MIDVAGHVNRQARAAILGNRWGENVGSRAGSWAIWIPTAVQKAEQGTMLPASYRKLELKLAAKTELGNSHGGRGQYPPIPNRCPAASRHSSSGGRHSSLQAELDVATIDLARFQQLNQSGAVSRQELDRQQATVNRLAGRPGKC